MRFKYNFDKNALLLKQRGIGFEEIIHLISAGCLLDIRKHHNQMQYPDQYILYVRVIAEVYAVPALKEPNGDFFLKTVFPSRKARKNFLKS